MRPRAMKPAYVLVCLLGVTACSGPSERDGGMDARPPICGALGEGCDPACCDGLRCEGTFCVAIECVAEGTTCSEDGDCCTLNCTDAGTCGPIICRAEGAACVIDGECCTNACEADVCAPSICRLQGESCTDAPCCPGLACDAGACAPDVPCASIGDSCTSAGGCCSAVCVDGAGNDCTSGASGCVCGTGECRSSGEACTADAQCCNGLCDRPGGVADGVCAELGSCGVAGEPCSPEGVSGGSCCSAACLDPTGSGTPRCQYLGGCRIQDELCTSNEQCCSGACEVHGTTMDGRPIMRCANAGNCQPAGEVCFQGVSANCCPNGGGDQGCETTRSGIDRCLGGCDCGVLPGQACDPASTACDGGACCTDAFPNIQCQPGPDGTTNICCLDQGEPCALGDVCCCGVCAPDASAGGALRCCPDGGCIGPGEGTCTSDADCCRGCCNDATGLCTDDVAICGDCTLGQLGDLCTSDAQCCNTPTVRCNEEDPGVEFPTCILQ